MKDFKKGGSFGGGRGGFNKGGFDRPRFGGRPSFGGGDRGPVTMHPAVCGQCGASCEVPFIPNGKKPILCKECYAKAQPERDFDRGERSFEPAPRSFARFEKPAFKKDYGDRSFAPRAPFAREERPAASSDEVVRQLAALNAKFDSLLSKIEEMSIEDEE